MTYAEVSAEWDDHNAWATRARLARAFVDIGLKKFIESAATPRAIRATDVPGSVAEFTCEWLTSILARQVPGASVLSFVPGERSSGSTDRQAFAVTYNEAGQRAGLPTKLFNKHTASVRVRVFMKLAGTLENEAGFYRQIRPALPIETPQAYHVAIDRSAWRSAIILEDVRASKEAVFLDTKDRISRSCIESMLELLATVHGTWWRSPRLQSEFTWLRTPLQWVVNAGPMIHFRDRVMLGGRAAQSVVPEPLLAKEKEIWRAFGASLTSSSRKPHTLLHGDPHIGNYYRTRDGRVGIVDWQVTLKGSWEFDFAYTVLSCLTIGDRRNWEKELLQFYLDRLAAAGGEAPAFDEAWLAYRRQTLYTYLGWLCTLGAQYQQPHSTTMDVIARSGTAMIDLETLASLGA